MRFVIDRTFRSGEKQPCDGAVRDADGDWVIDVLSLDDLVSLSRRLDEPLIVFAPDAEHNMPAIEIYDDWRE